jgi:hypothetical protein
MVGADPPFSDAGVRDALRRQPSNQCPVFQGDHPSIVGVHFSPAKLSSFQAASTTLAASTLASPKEFLMARMGHASARAALIYQHATFERDRAVAEGLSTCHQARGERRCFVL